MLSTRRNKLTSSLLIALCIIHCNSQSSNNRTSTKPGDSNNDSSNATSTTKPTTTNQTIIPLPVTPSTTPSSQENNHNSTETSEITSLGSTTRITGSTNNFSTHTPVPENNNASSSSGSSNDQSTTAGITVTQNSPTTTVSTSTLTSQLSSITKKTRTTVTEPSTSLSPNKTSTAKKNATTLPVTGSSTVKNTIQGISTTILATTTNRTTTVLPMVSTTNQTSTKTTTTPLVTKTIAPSVTTTSQTTAGSTSKSTTNKPTTTLTSTPGTSGAQFVYINEIIVDKQGIFQKIEIQISNQLDLTHYAIVMVDGSTNKSLSVFCLRNGNKTKPGLLMVQFNSSSTLSNKGIGIAIYDTRNLTCGNSFTGDWNVNEVGLIDALVIGKTYEDISASLVNILTPGVDPFILDPSKYGQDRSISRCSNGKLRSTEMYAFINPSMGNDNGDKCTEREHFQNTLSIKMKMDCGQLRYPNNTINEHLMRQIIKLVVRDVNRKCQCGITRMHVEDPTVQCCTDAVLDMKFVAPNKLQDKEFLQSFKAFIEKTDNIEVNDQSYTLDQRCLNDCCNQVIKPLLKKDHSKDIRVTVAVIVTLLVLFLIIVLVVYMYMRKKKMAVQQFRMSRLEEDYEDFDDMTVGIANDDHDEFVGGQEATFDLKP